VVAGERPVIGGLGTVSALLAVAVGTVLTVVVHLAFAQAIDAFVRISERSDRAG
jgi:hypothetical protein